MGYEYTLLPVERLEPVAQVTHDVASAGSARDVCRALFHFLTRTTPTTSLDVALAPGSGGEAPTLMRCAYDAGALAAASGGTVIEERTPLPASAEAHLAAAREEDGRPQRTDAPSSSLPRVCVPIRAGERRLGTLTARGAYGARFEPEHMAALGVAANLAAVAIRNTGPAHDERGLRDVEIAARHAAETGQRHLQELIDFAPVMMATATGPEHVFTSANRRYLDALGRSDIVGKRVVDVLPEIEAQGIIAILDEVYRTGRPFTAEAMPMEIEVDGTRQCFYFDLAYQPLHTPGGDVHGILANINDVTEQVLATTRLALLHGDLAAAYEETLEGWARALDLKDQETAGHSQRVTRLAVELAKAVGLPEEALEHVRWGALLHDIGKMGVPDAILRKPGSLTAEEWEIMQSHTTYAAELLRPIKHLGPAMAIPLHHHEKWDGSGYPEGLRGEEIPIAARIFAVVDVYDALTNDRPYRPAWSVERTLEHLREQTGEHFDPVVVDAFLTLIASA